ncbi:MAG TPA: DNA methyltransferase, partial [Longimicrobiaceae bacterium]|nr:DNA methyltransferase [Longimicrobiaceae bacterium]
MHPQSPRLRALNEKWADVPAGERANLQSYLIELTDALGVTQPQPRGSGYEFEYAVPTTDRKTGRQSTNAVDLYRVDHFVLEGKHRGREGAGETTLRAAYAQAKHYTADLPHAPPPYLMVLDVGRTLLVWDRWSGTYGGFNLARRIDLRTLAERPEEIDFLRAVWDNPASLDPRGRAAAVTREVAARLAELSASLEERGHDPERVARFLMRCVFTMFAEDVELLAGKPFQTALAEYREDPDEFAATMEDLWKAMDEGRRFGLKKLLRFNGHFFRDASALPLARADLAVLYEAAKADWKQVEPTIFGTLLTRALDPKERHRLGAEYTPRGYVERVVRQAVEVPIRERWEPVQAEVIQLVELGKKRDRATAEKRLREFHSWLKSLRFLDPACGSGNFLYVTLHAVKRIELEVLRELWKLVHQAEIGILEKAEGAELGVEEVGPWQFHGIEIKPWAREIAELTLWIGYHQFWMEHHRGTNPPEPVLRDTGTLEQRDAVLAWDEIVEVPEKSRPDPTPRIPHPVTGKLVPDPDAR